MSDAQTFFVHVRGEAMRIYYAHPEACEEFRDHTAAAWISGLYPGLDPDPDQGPAIEFIPVIDAVVIGCGAGGSAMAWRLSKAGVKVVVLKPVLPLIPIRTTSWMSSAGKPANFQKSLAASGPMWSPPCPFEKLPNRT